MNKLHVKAKDETGLWVIYDECGYLCALESKSTAENIAHAVNTLPELTDALENLVDRNLIKDKHGDHYDEVLYVLGRAKTIKSAE